MTKEENCIYLLVKDTLREFYNNPKLPKTMTTVKWVCKLKTLLERRYLGCMIDTYSRIDNKFHGIVLVHEMLNQAVRYMLIREILACGPTIISDPTKLPSVYNAETLLDDHWVLCRYLPSKFKNQGFTN